MLSVFVHLVRVAYVSQSSVAVNRATVVVYCVLAVIILTSGTRLRNHYDVLYTTELVGLNSHYILIQIAPEHFRTPSS